MALPNKQINTPAHGSFVDSWDVPTNDSLTKIDAAFGNYTTLNANGLSGVIPLNSSQTIPLGFIVTGTPAGNITYQTPAGMGGIWLVRNAATLGASITLGFASASGGSTVNIPAGKNLAISADGTANGMADIDTVPTSVAGGSNTQVQVNVSGVLGAYPTFTFDGTTLRVPAIIVDGNTTLGHDAGSTLTIEGTAISAPNGFNFNAGKFEMNVAGDVGIGVAPTASLLAVGGNIESTAGGYVFPDSTVQTTAAVTSTNTWTPIDASAGALTFTAASGRYQRIGTMVIATFSITYPANSDGNLTSIGGLPVAAANQDYANTAAWLQNNGLTTGVNAVMVKNTTTFGLWSLPAGHYNNAQMAGITVSGCIIYPTS